MFGLPILSPMKAPHCAFRTFRCGLLFGLESFLFSSLGHLPGVFPYLFYLFIKIGTWNHLVASSLLQLRSKKECRFLAFKTW